LVAAFDIARFNADAERVGNESLFAVECESSSD
jgi:hypothetical protein